MHAHQPFSSHSTHKLKFCSTHKNIFLAILGIILIHSHLVAIAVLSVVILLFDSREKKSVPLTEQSGTAHCKNPAAHHVKIAALRLEWEFAVNGFGFQFGDSIAGLCERKT